MQSDWLAGETGRGSHKRRRDWENKWGRKDAEDIPQLLDRMWRSYVGGDGGWI